MVDGQLVDSVITFTLQGELGKPPVLWWLIVQISIGDGLASSVMSLCFCLTACFWQNKDALSIILWKHTDDLTTIHVSLFRVQRRRQENSSGGPSLGLGGGGPTLPPPSPIPPPSLPFPCPYLPLSSPPLPYLPLLFSSLPLSSLPLPLEVGPLKSS